MFWMMAWVFRLGTFLRRPRYPRAFAVLGEVFAWLVHLVTVVAVAHGYLYVSLAAPEPFVGRLGLCIAYVVLRVVIVYPNRGRKDERHVK